MNKYRFNIEEVLNREIMIEANNFEEAMKIINRLYKEGEIILDYSDFVGYTIDHIKEENKLALF